MAKNLLHRLGTYTAWALVSSTLALVAVVVFLHFVWFGNETDTAWRDLVSQDWRLPSAVTLSALVIRAAVAAQTAAAISLVAAVLLETHVKLSRVPEISIMRFANPGSCVTGWIMLETVAKSPVAGILGFSLLVCSLALQFSSTILLTDFDTVPALTTNITTELNVALSGAVAARLPQDDVAFGDVWATRPSSYQAFAEYHDPTYRQFSEDIHDTGVTIRGFLPISDRSQREALFRYHGYSTLVDMRVACVRPDLQDVQLKEATRWAAPISYPQFVGRVTAGDVPLLPPQMINQTMAFRCLGPDTSDSGPVWAGLGSFTLCPLDLPATGLASRLTHGTQLGNAYLLLEHMNSSIESVSSAGILTSQDWTASPDGLWTKLSPPPSAESKAGVRATLCFDARNLVNTTRLVTATSATTTRAEPEVGITAPGAANDGNSYTARFDTKAVRTQLGATIPILDHEKRGVLDLHVTPDFSEPQLAVKGGGGGHNPALNQNLGFSTIHPHLGIDAIFLCYGCLPGHKWQSMPGNVHLADERVRDIFLDTLEDTGSPALALQAIFTVVMQMGYQKLMPYFSLQDTGIITVKKSVRLPVSKRGFGIVAGLVAAHCVLVLVAVVLFARFSRHTVLSNMWQVMTQMVEEDGLDGARSPGYLGGDHFYHDLCDRGRRRVGTGWSLKAVPGPGAGSPRRDISPIVSIRPNQSSRASRASTASSFKSQESAKSETSSTVQAP